VTVTAYPEGSFVEEGKLLVEFNPLEEADTEGEENK
jgi:hypothetical protein